MSSLYLILHKVRGEPAFDIAQLVCQASGGQPCQPSCGCWKDGECSMEGEWIIPTSGHTAYPACYWPLNEVAIGEAAGFLLPMLDHPFIPVGDGVVLPDHYQPKAEPCTLATTARSLLASLGLGGKPIKRRKI